ncbi:maltose alpha-D-glucosyltransferase [Aurantiacibacter poecillastricola]|uniref:maltose alpha-D-glucosyltransferase n=1 Tax=Aurantiacibacter poecillastricola TaxID=3064385 RepID=UPI00273E4CC6|nr:maltose alpha-D-glucosyltransferase [Aurantiacibacter sp. 219JJ12-13]MDP5261320.1 maltose alpha-D-glucosyltransferase [Aurantiacibacter sp. 219JJ12-13]
MNKHSAPPTMTATVTGSDDPYWYKDAVIYQLHVKSFFDSNNDGIGDFAGLMEKLDYVADLGVTAIWLLPFYPSPRRDDGYDISDYTDVSPDYGTIEEARAFVEAAHERGIRVITELIINHTSDQHPWFQAARKAPPGSPERDFYVWSDDDKLYSGTRIIFLDTEKSNWTWDEEAGAYFWHRFYSHQPDLNFDNPEVLKRVLEVMHFWLDAGIDGLRLDAIPYLIERDGTSNENLPETHDVLKKIRADLDEHYEGKMLLAEANMWPEDTQAYFGEKETGKGSISDECHMAFHFPLMPRMYMAVAQEDRFPITDIMRQTPDIPDDAQWAIFLRNHDELTLEMVTDAERDYLWNTYAADRRARINLGIRRRLAPLMERDRRRIELMNALLLTMPGTPVLYYGDEIGMGDNIFLGDRDGVRTPMQWSPDRNGGFSKADPAALSLPVIQDPLYGYEAVNVEAQERDRHSLLNWIKRMLAVRKEHQAFGRGSQTFLRPRNRRILAYLRQHGQETILCVANLSRTAQAVELDLHQMEGFTPVELSGGTAFPRIGQLPYMLTLPPYGFLWFELTEETDAPDWASSAPGAEVERHTFVLRPDLADVTTGENSTVLRRDILPDYLPHRRWFGAKDETIEAVEFLAVTPLPGHDDLLLSEIAVTTASGTARYALPLGIAWEGEQNGPFASNLAIARVRRERTVGLLTDGFSLGEFAGSVLSGMRDGSVMPAEGGELRFEATDQFDIDLEAEPEWIAAEQSNSTMIVGSKAVLKLLRKLAPGIHPDAEMVRYLADNGFAGVPPVLGTVKRIENGEETLLMLAQEFVYNQGDGWQWTLGSLERLATDTDWSFSNYENFATNLGRRLGQMHQTLARETDDAAFAPEPLDAEGAEALAERIGSEVDRAIARMGDEYSLADKAAALKSRIAEVAKSAIGTPRTRIHGDLHLGQVLVTGSDVMIIDFEGEPTRPLAERRGKDIPLRDVAGLVRSFDYAAAVAERSRPAAADTWEARAEEGVARFRTRAIDAFLEGYGFDTESERDPLLDLFILEKAAYEVSYEAANRPDWIEVPAQGLARAADRLLSGDAN